MAIEDDARRACVYEFSRFKIPTAVYDRLRPLHISSAEFHRSSPNADLSGRVENGFRAAAGVPRGFGVTEIDILHFDAEALEIRLRAST